MILKQSIPLLVLALGCFGAAHSSSKLLSYHVFATEIHNGPIKYHEDQSDPSNSGIRYRAVIGIEESYYFLVVEKHIVGDEGWLSFHSYKTVETGSRSRIEFVNWDSTATFVIKQDGSEKRVTIKNDGSATLE